MAARRVKLSKEVELVVPLAPVRLTLIADHTRNLSTFSVFVLWVLGSGHGREMIAEVTCLPARVIQDELDYLEKVQYCEPSRPGEPPRLSATGKRILDVKAHVDSVNSNPPSGLLLPVERQSQCRPVGRDGPWWPKLMRELLRNEDFGNSRAYVFEISPLPATLLGEADAIHVLLEQTAPPQGFVYPLASIPVSDAPHTALARLPGCGSDELIASVSHDSPYVTVGRRFIPIRIAMRHRTLDEVRDLLPHLATINKSRPEMLTPGGRDPLQWACYEAACNEALGTIWLDTLTGELFRERPTSSDLVSKADWVLPDQFGLEGVESRRLASTLLGFEVDTGLWNVGAEKVGEPLILVERWPAAVLFDEVKAERNGGGL